MFNDYIKKKILDESISQLFSNNIKFTTMKLSIFLKNNLSTPYFETKNQPISRIFGKIDENNTNSNLIISFSFQENINNKINVFYKKLSLKGVRESIGTLEKVLSQDTIEDLNEYDKILIQRLERFSNSFKLNDLGKDDIQIKCIGINKLKKTDYAFKRLSSLKQDEMPKDIFTITQLDIIGFKSYNLFSSIQFILLYIKYKLINY